MCPNATLPIMKFLSPIGLSSHQTISTHGQAWAEDTLSEDQLFGKIIERATSAYRDKKYQDAIKYFKRAMMFRSNPNIHWNLSVCYHKIGAYQKSLFHANEYLGNGSPNQKMRTKIKARKRELLKHLQQKYLAPQSESTNSKATSKSESIDIPPLRPNRSQTLRPSSPENIAIGKQPIASHASSQKTGRRNAIISGSVGATLLASSFGLHLYADSVWDSRPSGGGAAAQEAKRQALLVSWVGDGLLVLSLTSLIVGAITYFNLSNEEQPQACLECTQSRRGFLNVKRQSTKPITQTLGIPTFSLLHNPSRETKLEYHGGLLGWLIKF